MMDQFTLSSSRVKVECHDPYKVFSCVVQDFEARLPLRNLNWNPSYRPLRLIDTLYVSFETFDPPSDAKSESPGLKDTRLDASRDAPKPQRERRHQIPGLRQTPYLKILFVKCDDSEAYKNTLRKEIREWIKKSTLSSTKGNKSSSQEIHDTFEWLIVHVVLPNKDREMVWPDRNSAKILQYLKDDFNGSSRNATDRVAQIASMKIASDVAKAQIVGPTFKQESNESWEDALGKLKHLILISFDQRVRQYEEDIREKGAQKSLPGWNFNTFFVLKEGLARGFESVGLVEDALSSYDELQLELDATVRNKCDSVDDSQDATIFKDFSPSVEMICNTIGTDMIAQATKTFESRFMDVENDSYRELILSSDVSAFDFKVYVFVRQIKLLRRLGEATGTGQTSGPLLNPQFSSEICERTATFITSTSRVLHYDASICLRRLATSQQTGLNWTEKASELVLVWTYLVACIVLRLSGDIQTLEASKPSRIVSQDLNPDLEPTERPLLQPQGTSIPPAHLRGLLANRRAGLIKTARRALEQLARRRDWTCGWVAVLRQLQSVNVEPLAQDIAIHAPNRNADHISSLWVESLALSLETEASFRARYEILTNEALQNHREAEDARSMWALQVDLAICKLLRREYEQASLDFKSADQNYMRSAWPTPHLQITLVIAYCCKYLKDDHGFIKSCLKLVTNSHSSFERTLSHYRALSSGKEGLLTDAIELSRSLSEKIRVPLDDFAQEIVVEPYADFLDDSDGVSLELRLRVTALSGLRIDRISLSLFSSDSDNETSCEFTAESTLMHISEAQLIRLTTHDFAEGRYQLEKMDIRAGNISFEKRFLVRDTQPDNQPKINQPNSKVEGILIWTPMTIVDTEIDIFELVDLDRPKSLVITITFNKRQITSLALRLMARTSGLRLHTAQASVATGACEFDKHSVPGLLVLCDIGQDSDLRILVPFQTDLDVKDIMIRSQTEYLYANKTTRVGKMHRVSNSLPLGVNVQDVFKPGKLFSKFSVSTSTRIPIQITDFDLQAVSGRTTAAPRKWTVTYPVLSKQPVTLIYRVDVAIQKVIDEDKKITDLKLRIEYQCLDDEIFATVKALLVSHVVQEDLGVYARLLWGHMHKYLRQNLRYQDMDNIALVREFGLPVFESLEWTALLEAIRSEDSKRLSRFLESWHRVNQRIKLPRWSHDTRNRSINIPVAIPPLQVLYSTEMQIIDHGVAVNWHVGDAIPLEISIKFTQAWAKSPEHSTKRIATIFELDASPDTWIIGGQRRGTLVTEEDGVTKFVTLLLPQRSGNLILPSLEVRSRNIEDHIDLHSELDNRSQGKSILVLPGLTKPATGSNIRPEKRTIMMNRS